MVSKEEARDLKILAKQIQIETINCISSLGSGHVGGSLSIADVLSVLYGRYMKYDASNPAWDERDRLVLSKGHAGPALYATLAIHGFFDKELLSTLNKPGTRLPSHADRILTPGVDMTCGSLGQGGSAAAGMALGFKLDGKPNTVYAILGDGELDEGQIWEMVLFAAAKKLNNLIVFVDKNGLQLDNFTDLVCPLGDVAAKFDAFGWFAQTVNGHDTAAICSAIDAAKGKDDERPSVIVLNTVKGQGWSKVENQVGSHSCSVNAEEAAEAKAEMQAVIDSLKEVK